MVTGVGSGGESTTGGGEVGVGTSITFSCKRLITTKK